jgi:hypothetical protein
VQVLGLLVLPEIRYDMGAADLRHHDLRDPLDDGQQLLTVPVADEASRVVVEA